MEPNAHIQKKKKKQPDRNDEYFVFSDNFLLFSTFNYLLLATRHMNLFSNNIWFGWHLFAFSLCLSHFLSLRNIRFTWVFFVISAIKFGMVNCDRQHKNREINFIFFSVFFCDFSDFNRFTLEFSKHTCFSWVFEKN